LLAFAGALLLSHSGARLVMPASLQRLV